MVEARISLFRILVFVSVLAACVALGCDSDSKAGGGGAGGEAGTAGSAGGAGGSVGEGGAGGQGGVSGGGAVGGMGGVSGAGGSAGSAGAGGSGGCVDRIGNRPKLTAQPVLDDDVASPGDTLMLQVPVSDQTVLVRARAIVDNTTAVGEAVVATQGSEVVQIPLPLDANPSVSRPSEAYVGLTLCAQETNCLSGPNRTFVSYVRVVDAATLYLINVFDDGMQTQEVSGSSCYDVLSFTLADP